MFIPDDMNDRFLSTHESFYCINGHRQAYVGETKEQKLKKQLEIANRSKKFAEQSADQARKRERKAKKQAAAHKGVATRLKNRAKAGVCPCCTRTFKQLAAHMKNKHPNYNEGKKK